MRYIKIGVPDDFDEEAVSDSLHLVDYTKDGSQGTTPVELWAPEYINVLDHGHIGLVDMMGDDMNIVHSARVSYGRGTKKVNTDRGLIRYLMRHRHTTPFEMVEFLFHVKAPIFVFRQWHRHRTASINEYSGRYSVLDSDMYMPQRAQTAVQSTNNRQGRDDTSVTEEEYLAILAAMEQVFHDSYDTYTYLLGSEGDDPPPPPDAINNRRLWVEESALKAAAAVRDRMLESDEEFTNEDAERLIEEKMKEYYAANELAVLDEDFPGLSRELARCVLPVATYSQMYWKANLKNILHFIGLRSDPHAQWEIRQYSDAMLKLIEPYVPWAIEAFLDYEFEGANLSRVELEAIAHMQEQLVELSEDAYDEDYWNGFLREKGASVREVNEFMEKLKKGAGERHFKDMVK